MTPPKTRGQKVIAFIEKYCKVPEGESVGDPLILADFQKKFITEVYDNPAGTRKAYLSISRKNGKSGLIAGLLLAHLVGPEAVQNSQIASGAMSREQAGIIFDLAVKMIIQNPVLSKIIKIQPSGKRLIGLPMNVHYKALASEAKTAHGQSLVFCLIDEIGQIRGARSDFIESLETSQGAYKNALLIAISTQAATDGDLFSIWLDAAAKKDDARIISHVYTAPPECDLLDRKAWKAANPALGLFRSKEDLKAQLQEAARVPSKENGARNLLLNQRINTVSPFINASIWKANQSEFKPLDGVVYGGLDLSKRTDLTALVLICKVDSIWQVKSYFWTPEQGLEDRAKKDRCPYDLWVKQGFIKTVPGATIDYSVIAADISEILNDYDIKAIAFDRWRIDILKKEFERLEVEPPLVEFGQGFKDMSPAIEALEGELLNKRINHNENPVLTMCSFNAVVTTDPAGSRKLDKSKATGRIDGLQALAMAIGIAEKTDDTEHDYSNIINFI